MPFLLGYFGKGDSYPKRIARSVERYQEYGPLSYAKGDQLFAVASRYHGQDDQDGIIPVMDGQQGLLIGSLFTKDTYLPVDSFNDTQVAIAEHPLLLAQQYWGRYSGVLFNQTTNQITLVRDPVGLTTLFYMPLADGILFASELSLLIDLLDSSPALDWQFFTNYLVGQTYELAATPFKNILELQPGMALHYALNGTSKQELLWDLSFITQPLPNDPIEVEELVLHTLLQSTKAWVARSKGICVELSGGLDSSGIMVLLREVLRADQKLIAVNYIDSQEPSANEIQHAQRAADACDAPLYFIDAVHSNFMNVAKPGWRTNKPSNFLLHGENDVRLHTLLQEQGCSDLINGQGGDHIFLAPALKNALADYWLQNGFKGSGAIAQELTAYYRSPWLSMMGYNIKAVGHYYWGSVQEELQRPNCLSKDALRTFKPAQHYLQKKSLNYYPAKAVHMQALTQAVHFADRSQRIPNFTITHPLLSQPVVELGWRIPTYNTFGQGYDRIIFRKAVSRLKNIPPLWRTVKGETSASVLRSLKKNMKDMQALFNQGQLLKNGLIDTAWYHKTLLEVQHGTIEGVHPLISMLTVEQWLKQWNIK